MLMRKPRHLNQNIKAKPTISALLHAKTPSIKTQKNTLTAQPAAQADHADVDAEVIKSKNGDAGAKPANHTFVLLHNSAYA